MVATIHGSPVGPLYNKTNFYIPNIIFLVLSILFVVLRICSRRIQRLRLDASDYCIVIALVLSILVSAAACIGIENGAGEHIAYLYSLDHSGGKVVFLLKILMLATIPYLISLAFSRLSILLLYRSIFQTPFMRVASVLLGTSVSLIAISAMLATVFSCNPVEGFWLKHTLDPRPKCLNTQLLYLVVGLLTVVMDLACFVLPIWDIVQLKLSKRDKVVVLALFFMGGLTIVVSVPRTIVVAQGDDNDISFWLASIALWSSIETAVAIICVCLPVLRPVIRRLGALAGGNRDVRELGAMRSGGFSSVQDDAERERSLHNPGELSPAQLDALFPEIDIELEKASIKAIDRSDDAPKKSSRNRRADRTPTVAVVAVTPPAPPASKPERPPREAHRQEERAAARFAGDPPTGRRKPSARWESSRAHTAAQVGEVRDPRSDQGGAGRMTNQEYERDGFF